MRTTSTATAVGVFPTHSQAQRAVAELKQAGFRDDQIGVISRQGTTEREGEGSGNLAAEGALAGVAAGAGIGGMWAIGIAAGVLPAIGPVIAGGILAALAASAAAGAAAGGLVGALIGLGIPEEEAEYYHTEVQAGRTIITVKDTERQDEVKRIFRQHGGYDASSRASAPTPVAATSTTPQATGSKMSGSCSTDVAGNQKIQVREEELHVRKQPVETGEVRVRKEVHTEHRVVDVPVTREEIVIERRSGTGTPAAGTIGTDEEIRVPVSEEQVQIVKEPVVKEEVSIGKRTVRETKKVSADLRKEDVTIEKSGNPKVDDRSR